MAIPGLEAESAGLDSSFGVSGRRKARNKGQGSPNSLPQVWAKGFRVVVINQSVASFRQEQVKKAKQAKTRAKRKAARASLELADAKRRLRISYLESIKGKSDNDIAAVMHATSGDFLLSPQWRAIRRLAIKKHGNACLKCGRLGTKDEPMNVDHIKPRKFFPELALDVNNLQPLCWRCNKAKGNTVADYRKGASS